MVPLDIGGAPCPYPVSIAPLNADPAALAAALTAAAPLACLRIGPSRWIVGRGPFTACAEPPPGEVAFYVNDFALSDPAPWRLPAEAWETDRLPLDRAPDLQLEWRPPGRAGFETAFEEVKAGLRSGRWRKAVLAIAEKGRLVHGGAEAFAAKTLLHREAAVCWPAVWQDSGSGFAAVTPEVLFTLRQGTLSTMALAGTATPVDREGFVADEKEIREHELVADMLRERLADWGTVHARPREVLNIGGLLHFLTRLEVDTGNCTTDELIRALHPTPAIGIHPRTAENLAALQSWRSRLGIPPQFGAPFGVQWRGGVHVVVAIRGVWWHGTDLLLPAGCGIVEGSQLEREWRELSLKRRWVRETLGVE